MESLLLPFFLLLCPLLLSPFPHVYDSVIQVTAYMSEANRNVGEAKMVGQSEK